jgi:hypothetical protein
VVFLVLVALTSTTGSSSDAAGGVRAVSSEILMLAICQRQRKYSLVKLTNAS